MAANKRAQLGTIYTAVPTQETPDKVFSLEFNAQKQPLGGSWSSQVIWVLKHASGDSWPRCKDLMMHTLLIDICKRSENEREAWGSLRL